MKKNSVSKWILVIILFLIFVGMMVSTILNPKGNTNTVSNNKSNEVVTNNETSNTTPDEAVKKANEQYKGYSDYIVSPSRTHYKIEDIYWENERVFIKIADSDIFSKSENDMTYGNALGNTISLLMSDFFEEGTILVIECEENIVFTGNVL